MPRKQPEETLLCPARECRKHARNCLRIAEASANAEITRTFVDLAHSWTRLALELESAQALLVAVEDMEQVGGSERPRLDPNNKKRASAQLIGCRRPLPGNHPD